jgi:hypothetical protein
MGCGRGRCRGGSRWCLDRCRSQHSVSPTAEQPVCAAFTLQDVVPRASRQDIASSRDTLRRVVAAATQQPSVAPGNLQHVGSGSTGQSCLGGLAPNGISAGAASDDQTTAKGRGFELVVASSDANDDGVASGVVGPFGSAAERGMQSTAAR